ncbi:uncharacterized protein [Primulina huaijiensis]|uniref:uncharacterized protein n=1 Tax=Primulina huaijiensis TaxID=1492673 RepID=UPI003CC756D4
MACLVVSIGITFLAWAIVISSSVPKVASIAPASSLIKDVCVGRELPIDFNLCVEILNSEPRVVSASDLTSIAIAITEAGLSKAKKTQWYVRKLQKQPGRTPDYGYVLQQCNAAYELYLVHFRNALDTVKYEDYLSAAYNLKAGYTDDINQCRNAQSSRKVKDAVISKGNELMLMFADVAFQTVDRLIT